MARKSTLFFWLILLFFLASAEEQPKVREYLKTGNWYPADRGELNRQLDSLFENVQPPKVAGRVQGIIAPHAGLVFSGKCSAGVYRALKPTDGVRRIILLGVAHRGGFYGACTADFDFFSTPLGRIAVDMKTVLELSRKKNFRMDREIMQYEHSLENQLPFLQKALGNDGYRIVPILFGSLRKGDFQAMADIIRPYVDETTVVVASTDLTHYGEGFQYVPFSSGIEKNLTRLDRGLIDPILALDFDSYHRYIEKTGITACGIVPVGVLIRLFDKRNSAATLVDYYKSGDLNRDYSTSVSYASILITPRPNAASAGKRDAPESPAGLNRQERKILIAIARSTIEARIGKKEAPSIDDRDPALTPGLKENRGVFVTLREGEALRGCIGSIVGTEPLWRGVIRNAVHAAVDDPRFPPVEESELKRIGIEISVMTPLERIADYRRIRLGTDGVVIRDGYGQAVFLPQVATETGWSLDEFLSQLCRKGGMPADAYRTSKTMEFQIFQAQVFGETEK